MNPNAHFVVTPTGAIGLTAGMTPAGRIRVQFGPQGPFSAFKEGSLRYATEDEVDAAGLHGVGGQFGGR